jgi:hypothetical protein
MYYAGWTAEETSEIEAFATTISEGSTTIVVVQLPRRRNHDSVAGAGLVVPARYNCLRLAEVVALAGIPKGCSELEIGNETGRLLLELDDSTTDGSCACVRSEALNFSMMCLM